MQGTTRKINIETQRTKRSIANTPKSTLFGDITHQRISQSGICIPGGDPVTVRKRSSSAPQLDRAIRQPPLSCTPPPSLQIETQSPDHRQFFDKESSLTMLEELILDPDANQLPIPRSCESLLLEDEVNDDNTTATTPGFQQVDSTDSIETILPIKIAFDRLLDIPKIGAISPTSPIVVGDLDGSAARMILAALQAGKIQLTKKGVHSPSSITYN